MNLPDAIRAANFTGRIRRRGWVTGFWVWWSPEQQSWMYRNAFETMLDPPGSRKLDMNESQGCITPATIVADDWEVAP